MNPKLSLSGVELDLMSHIWIFLKVVSRTWSFIYFSHSHDSFTLKVMLIDPILVEL